MAIEHWDIRFYLERPTQFEAPFFRFLHERGHLRLLAVFERGVRSHYDSEQSRELVWGFDLESGYPLRRLTPWMMLWDSARSGPVVIFNGYSRPHLVVSALLARLLGKRVFLRTDSVIFPDGRVSSPSRRALKRLIHLIYCGYLVTGIGGRRYLSEYLELPLGKLVVDFPYCVDIRTFARIGANEREIDERCGTGDTAKVPPISDGSRIALLVVAKLNDRESPFDLIACLELFPELRLNCTVTVIGAGDRQADLEGICARAGLGATIRFSGYVPYAQLPEVYAQHQVFYHGPVFEPFGVSVIEAAAAGLYVLTNTRVGAAEELGRFSSAVSMHAIGDLAGLRDLLLHLSNRKLDRSDISRQCCAGFGYDVLEKRWAIGLGLEHSEHGSVS